MNVTEAQDELPASEILPSIELKILEVSLYEAKGHTMPKALVARNERCSLQYQPVSTPLSQFCTCVDTVADIETS